MAEIFLDRRTFSVVALALEYLRSPYYILWMKGKPEVMTARELARRIKVPHTTVMGWLQKGQVPGARAETVGEFKVWIVPVEAVHDYPRWRPKRGRPPLSQEEKAARAKKRPAGAQTSLFEPPATTAKPKAMAKKATKKKGAAK